jgi:signal transduction histidine kinase
MNPISAFFVRNIVAVFFFYGLAFFAMGLALALASQRTSEFKFIRAIRPLAVFGILHGIHEWYEMFQKIAALTMGYTPTFSQEAIRLVLLSSSFLMLFVFGVTLLSPTVLKRRQMLLFSTAMIGLWLFSSLGAVVLLEATLEEALRLADVLARYSLGIPGALIGTWALMTQQRTFREHGMPQFGRDLVWSATALFIYGVIGQLFVRSTELVPSNIINSTLFLQWFGIPVQLFRGVMATVLAVFLVRALNAFELESQQRLDAANKARLEAQAAALQAERRHSRQIEQLYQELQLTAEELSLLLDLSNLLAAPLSLSTRLKNVLEEIVRNLQFPDACLILLLDRQTGALDMEISTGFEEQPTLYDQAEDLGQQCITSAVAMCRHKDDQVIEFPVEQALERRECELYPSPVTILGLPLTVQGSVTGSIALAHTSSPQEEGLSLDEFKLILGVAQQLGLSIENARLYQEAQEREQLLGNLLHQVVGAQEAERQRIARELHDATGQSLTAIALGLRGTESLLASNAGAPVEQIRELRSISTEALGELRQLIADLRPSQLDDLGLVAALQWYTQEFEKRYNLPTKFDIEGERTRLPSEYEIVLFRIVQEALTNVAKHAQASHVSVTLDAQPTQIQVSVCDDGHGFSPEKQLRGGTSLTGWGLLGIQERTALLGGKYEIESEPGHGTCVRAQIPITTELKNVQDTTVTD